jgi:hypothetical protein
MAQSAEPLVARRARADLQRISRIMRGMLSVWLNRLASGQVDPDEIHRLIGSTRWRWVEFAGYAVIFRSLEDSELEKIQALLPTLVIARIVPVADIQRLGAQLLQLEDEAGEGGD